METLTSMQKFMDTWQQAIDKPYRRLTILGSKRSERDEMSRRVESHCEIIRNRQLTDDELKAYQNVLTQIRLAIMDSPKNDPDNVSTVFVWTAYCMAVFEPQELCKLVVDDPFRLKAWFRGNRSKIGRSRYQDLDIIASRFDVDGIWRDF